MSLNKIDGQIQDQIQKKEDKEIAFLKEQNMDPHYLTKETREEKDIPLLEEMEEKKFTQQNEHKEQSEVSTLVANEEKLEPKKCDSKKEILYSTYIVKENSDQDSLYEKIELFSLTQEPSLKESQKTETKSEIPKSFLNKKTKKDEEFPINKKLNVNKNVKIKNCIDEDSDSLHYDNNPYDDDLLFDKFYGNEETEDIKEETPNEYEGQDDLNNYEENIYDNNKEDIFESKNIINEIENEDLFHLDKFNQDLSCNKNDYNKGIIEEGEINGEISYDAAYILDPAEDNTSTYYKSKI